MQTIGQYRHFSDADGVLDVKMIRFGVKMIMFKVKVVFEGKVAQVQSEGGFRGKSGSNPR
jgi:hypothetical protein